VCYDDLTTPWYGGELHCTVWSGRVHGRKCFFVEPHPVEWFFGRDRIYGYHDDVARFTAFSKATLEFLAKAGKRPDVIHCHDWPTGMVPVLLHEQFRRALPDQKVCYTIHNFAHQGVSGQDEVLWSTQLGRPEYFLAQDRLGDDYRYGAVNLMKGGIVYSDFVATVSPNHAAEVTYGDGAFGLGRTIHVHRHKFGGILNGIDYDVWNPEADSVIPARYSSETLEGKSENKEGLRDRFWLREEPGPIVAYVGRLDGQKGMHLVHHALFYALANGAQFVLLGGAVHENRISGHFRHLKRHLNDNPDCHLEIGYTEELAHLVYAGADMLVVPSMFEPCGLAPMIGQRYGTVPVVRSVGGLVDTVFDRDYSPREPNERNGYVFQHTDDRALESALNRALDLWFANPREFRTLMRNAMCTNHSWSQPGQQYLNVYERICNQ
jgi:starch synthase